MEEVQQGFDQWCVVEIMGHQRLAGRVTETKLASVGLLRVDVPEVPAGQKWGSAVPAIAAFTTYISPGSIYRLTPCSEEVARAAVVQFREQPVSCVQMPAARALPPAGTPADVGLEAVDEYEVEECEHCGARYKGRAGLCGDCRNALADTEAEEADEQYADAAARARDEGAGTD